MICHYCYPQSIKANQFVQFLEIIRSKSRNDTRLNILLDNCSIHKTKAVTDAATRLNINLIYNVPYKPEYNSIELLWAIAKQKFRARLLN